MVVVAVVFFCCSRKAAGYISLDDLPMIKSDNHGRDDEVVIFVRGHRCFETAEQLW